MIFSPIFFLERWKRAALSGRKLLSGIEQSAHFATILKTKTSDSVSALLGERSTKCLLYSEMVLPNMEDTTSSYTLQHERPKEDALCF